MFLRTYAIIGCIFICSLFIDQPIFAQNPSITATVKGTKRDFETSKEKLVKIQRLLNIYSTIGRFSGVAVITQNGNYVHRFTTNYATLDYKIRCSLATQFNNCDITEIFTTTAVMQLFDKGKIGMDDEIGQYIFNLPSEISKITLHQLLTHTSGLKNYYDLEEYRRGFYDIEDIQMLMDITTKYPLEFTPGSKHKKSSTAYLFLAAIIEKITGISYQEYIEKNILEPNEMEDSGVYSWFDPAEQKAVGYLRNERNQPKEAPEYWGAHAYGADGVHTSIEDLVKFNNAFQSGKLFSKEAQSLVLTPHLKNPNNSQENIGYGWNLKESNGYKIYRQSGHLGGISTDLRYYVKEGYGVIIYSNYGEGTASIVANKIEEILTTHTSTVPNYAVSFVLEELIETKGIGYVAENFDAVLEKNNINLIDSWPLYFLGKDYIAKNQPNVAIKLYELSIGKFPKHPMLYDAIGECYFKILGDCQTAREAFKKKLELQPSDARAKTMLQTFEKLNCSSLPKPTQNLVRQNSSVSNKPFVLQKDAPQEPSIQIETQLDYSEKDTDSNESMQVVKDVPNPPKMKAEEEKVYTIVDEMPQFPGGQKALHQYIYKNLKYPASAYVNDIEKTIYVDFSIDTQGNVINAKVDNPIEGNDGGITLEALRLINSMPKWKAGIHEGQDVVVQMKVPIRFSKKQFIGSEKID